MDKQNEWKDELYMSLSHELNTPLNVIYSTVQLMERYFEQDNLESKRDKLTNGVEVIKQNCFRFTKLIENITDLARMDSGSYALSVRNVDIISLLDGIVQEILAYDKAGNLRITMRSNVKERILSMDTAKIKKVILNLISNAIKFSAPGSNIFIEVTDEADWIAVSVIDEGIGIDELDLESIFHKYHQLDHSLSRIAEGSGVGLFLAKNIIELHGGSISVISKIGKGSTFKVLLPVKMENGQFAIDQADGEKNSKEMVKIELSDIYSI